MSSVCLTSISHETLFWVRYSHFLLLQQLAAVSLCSHIYILSCSHNSQNCSSSQHSATHADVMFTKAMMSSQMLCSARQCGHRRCYVQQGNDVIADGREWLTRSVHTIMSEQIVQACVVNHPFTLGIIWVRFWQKYGQSSPVVMILQLYIKLPELGKILRTSTLYSLSKSWQKGYCTPDFLHCVSSRRNWKKFGQILGQTCACGSICLHFCK